MRNVATSSGRWRQRRPVPAREPPFQLLKPQFDLSEASTGDTETRYLEGYNELEKRSVFGENEQAEQQQGSA
jgi:hypothetical protein